MKVCQIGIMSTALSASLYAATAQDEAISGVYKTTAKVTMQWATEEVTSFQTEELYQIEQAASLYFSALLADKSHDAFKDSSKIISSSVQARLQKVASQHVTLESSVEILNIGETGIQDAAALLMFLTNKNTTDSSFSYLDSLIDLDYSIDLISFTNEDESSYLLLPVDEATETDLKTYTSKEKTLITVTSILAFALFAVSVILIWVAGGWLALRKQLKILLHSMADDIKRKPTQDTEDEEAVSPVADTQFTNPTGILGAKGYYGKNGPDPFNPAALEGLGVKMTPGRLRGNKDTEAFTPMSDATLYSDTDRAPLGITSMRKLIPGRDKSPRRAQRDSLESFGMKKLNYGGNK